MTAARGIELRAPHPPAPATGAVVAGLREHVAGTGPDRYMAPEIDGATDLVRSGRILEWAETATGPLQ
jgi:histidine ammonia-lyase